MRIRGCNGMTHEAKKLPADTLRLSCKSRAMIAEKLLESLEESDGIEAAIDVAEGRWKAYKEGKIKGIPIEEIFQRR